MNNIQTDQDYDWLMPYIERVYYYNRHRQCLALGLQIAFVHRDTMIVDKIKSMSDHESAYGQRVIVTTDLGYKVDAHHVVLTNGGWVA